MATLDELNKDIKVEYPAYPEVKNPYGNYEQAFNGVVEEYKNNPKQNLAELYMNAFPQKQVMPEKEKNARLMAASIADSVGVISDLISGLGGGLVGKRDTGGVARAEQYVNEMSRYQDALELDYRKGLFNAQAADSQANQQRNDTLFNLRLKSPEIGLKRAEFDNTNTFNRYQDALGKVDAANKAAIDKRDYTQKVKISNREYELAKESLKLKQGMLNDKANVKGEKTLLETTKNNILNKLKYFVSQKDFKDYELKESVLKADKLDAVKYLMYDDRFKDIFGEQENNESLNLEDTPEYIIGDIKEKETTASDPSVIFDPNKIRTKLMLEGLGYLGKYLK